MEFFWKLLSCVVLIHFGISEPELCASPQYLTLGQKGTVECAFQVGSFGTYWYETEDTNQKPFFYLQGNVKSGEGFESGDFDVHENGSLIIKSVSPDHDHIFTVVNLRNKESNPTEISIEVVVTVIPDNPYPSVDLCIGTAYCYAKLKENTVPVNCFANNTRPQVELSWKLRTAKGDREIPSERKNSEVNGLFTTLIRSDQYAIESDTFVLLLCEQEEVLPLWNRKAVIVLLEINQPRLNHAEPILVQMINETITLSCLHEGSSFFIWKRQFLDSRFIVLAHGSSGHIAIESSNYTLVNESSLVITGDPLSSGGIYVCYYGDGFNDGMVVYNVTVPSAISSVSSSPSTDSPVQSKNSSSLVSVIVPTAIIVPLALLVAVVILWKKHTRRETHAIPLGFSYAEIPKQENLISQTNTPDETTTVNSTSIKADLTASGRPNIYTLRYSKETIVEENCKIRKCEIGTKGDEILNEKVIMLVGEVGGGKTTLIRHLINYFLGVSWEDPYRFDIRLDVDEQNRVHDPSKDQTGWISVYSLLEYRIDSIPFVITLIDTPGISGESSKKEAITENIKRLFESDAINHVDIIAFVRKVSDQRLTQSQKNVIGSVFQLFGNDIMDNMYLFGTYASSTQNETFERAVRNSDLNLAGYLYFNNRPFSSSLEGKDETLKLSWEMSRRQFEKVSESLAKCSSVSLDLTTRMLNKRKNLETILDGLRDILQNFLTGYNNLKLQEDALNQRKDYIEVYEEFEEVHLENNEMALICTRCKYTCHYPCTASYPVRCDMIKVLSGCRSCKGNCNSSPHYIKNYRYERTTKTRIITDYCEIPESGAERTESLQQISEDMRQQKEKIVEQIDKIRECIRQLNENSPQGGDLTVKGYLNKIIEDEIKTKRAGWEERIGELNNLITEEKD